MNNKQKYDRKYHEEHYKRISLVVKKEYGDIIKDRAKDLGKSVNEYIVDLIMIDLDKRD